MFRVYTKHTESVGETVIEHLWFTLKVGMYMITSGFLLLAHGISGGLIPSPDSMSIEGIRGRMNKIADDREIKRKSVARAATTRKQLESLYSLKQEGDKDD